MRRATRKWGLWNTRCGGSPGERVRYFQTHHSCNGRSNEKRQSSTTPSSTRGKNIRISRRRQPLDFFFASRTGGESANVKSTTSSPVTVLMS